MSVFGKYDIFALEKVDKESLKEKIETGLLLYIQSLLPLIGSSSYVIYIYRLLCLRCMIRILMLQVNLKRLTIISLSALMGLLHTKR